MSKPICAWISRHKPTVLQVQSLQQYQIIQINRRFATVPEIWPCVMSACGGSVPSLVVAVLPREWLCPLLLRIPKQTALIQAVMLAAPEGEEQPWSGRWNQVLYRNKIVFQDWKPEAVQL